jgi:cell division protein FtsB
MAGYQQSHRFSKVLYSKITFVVLVVLVVFFSRSTWIILQKERESAQDAAQAEKQEADLESRQTVLSASIDRLSTPQGVEEDLREKYTIAKPGEKLFVILSPDSTTSTSSSQGQSAAASLWARLVSFFK